MNSATANPGSDMTGYTERPRGLRALVITSIGLLLFGLGIFTGFRVLEREYSCLDDYANKQADALEARQADNALLTQRDSEAWQAIEDLFAQQDPEGKKLRVAVLARIRAANQLEETRAEHPNPPPPREVC